MEERIPPSTLWLAAPVWVRSLLASSIFIVSACDDMDLDSSTSASTPHRMSRSGGVVPSPIAGVALGDGDTWVVTESGKLKGWGPHHCDGSGCLAPNQLPWLDLGVAVAEVASGGRYTAVRLIDGTVEAWKEVGGTPIPLPVDLPADELAAGIAVGLDFICLRLEGGAVHCDGLGSEGALAPLLDPQFEAPVMDLSAGARHACAVLSSGAVQCWGDNTNGQLASTPAIGVTTIALDGPASQVSAGAEHSCARLESGAVQCWGRNSNGQLGHADAGVGTVSLPDAAAMIATGAEHSCAITQSTAELYCWGRDDQGQLGRGEDLGSIRRVDLGGQAATTVFGGPAADTTFVRLEHHGVRGWGRNDTGQMGYGDLLEPPGDGFWNVGTLPDIDIYDGPDED